MTQKKFFFVDLEEEETRPLELTTRHCKLDEDNYKKE